MRTVILTMCLLLVGCGANKKTAPNDSPPPSLSEADKARWLKVLRKVRSKNVKRGRLAKYQYLACYKGKWKTVTIARVLNKTSPPSDECRFLDTLPEELDEMAKDMGVVIGGYLLETEVRTKDRVPLLVAIPDVSCVAVVDLYSKDSPEVISWHRDEGKGPQEFRPTPALENGAKAFLAKLQRTAE